MGVVTRGAGSVGVAVVGAACRFPGAAGLAAFHADLAAGRQRIGPPGADRVRQAGETPGVAYLPMAYLDRVDLFDHELFGIPLREAELMDPQQRLLLELAHQALEDAGKPPGRLRGSRTGVYIGAAGSGYASLFTEEDPQQILGTLPAAVAARIAYLLDLHGPAVVLDTACSSGLAAVAAAVAAVRAGTVDLAVAGAASVRVPLVPQAGYRPLRGVESPDATCRPFDARANGTAGGEGGAVVVLRRLADALAGGDRIHAVLTGAAVNHNGHRAVSMGAPSQLAEADVIAAACRDAGIEPADLGYVECHGSATPLGDVVELAALRRALGTAGTGPATSAIGSVKGNIGHLDGAAGPAGLIRAMLSVRHGVRYPAAGFGSADPQADLGPPLTVLTEAQDWPDRGGAPRRAGVSSFGLTGTNVHIVVEQPPAPPAPEVGAARPGGAGWELITVSAVSAGTLRRYCRRLADYLRRTEHPLRAVAHTLNRGRDHHPYRLAFTVDSVTAAAGALDGAEPPDRPAEPDIPTVLLFSADGELAEPAWAALRSTFPELAELASDVDGAPVDPAGRLVLRQYALYRLASALGLTGGRLVGSGAGNLVVRLARGELTAAAAVRAAAGRPVGPQVDVDRLRGAVEDFAGSGALLVEVGADGVLSREIHRLAPDLPVLPLVPGTDRAAVLGQLGRLYALGAALDWDRHYAGAAVGWVDVPTYPFAEIRCWCTPLAPAAQPPAPVAEPSASAEQPPARAGGAGEEGDIAARVSAVWTDVLKAPVRPDADYFELGGTSIAGISVLGRLERDFGVRLGFADLYAHRTARALAGRIGELLGERAVAGGAEPADIPRLPRGGRLPLSFGQQQLWYLDRLNPGTALYNLPSDLRLTGPLDQAALTGAVADLADRHEVLRSRLPSEDGEPYVLVADRGPELAVVDLSALPPGERDRRARAVLADTATRPFDLAAGPLWRAVLIRLAAEEHVLAHTWHHIAFDGWSPSVFFTDLAELYRARLDRRRPDLPELPVQYADVAGWQRSLLAGPRLERGLAHWRHRLAGLHRAELPLDRPRPPVQDFSGGLIEFTVDSAVAGRVREFGRRHGVTPFVTMLAAFGALLHRWAGMDDVVVGVATSGRGHPATRGLVGYFNNVLPFRTAVSGELSFAELAARTAGTVADVLDHEEIPFDRIVSALYGRRDPARHPVYDVAYTYQNAPTAAAGLLPGVAASRYLDSQIAGIAPGTAKFDLTLGVADQDGGPMPGHVEYATALFTVDTARRLADWYPALLAAALDDPAVPLGRIPLAGLGSGTAAAPGAAVPAAGGPAARTGAGATGDAPAVAGSAAVPAAGSMPAAGGVPVRGAGAANGAPAVATAAVPPPDLASGDGVDLPWWQAVERQAARRPDHPAVVCAGRSYSYRRLNQLANRLARRLHTAGVRPELPVPVVAGRDVDLVVGWLAVAKAGGAFVPVDPALPGPRIDTILSDVDARVAVVGRAWTGRRLAAEQLPVEPADDDAAADDDTDDLPAAAVASHLGYVCYTSGSNGRPHGCLVEHGQLAGVLRWYERLLGLSGADRVLQGAWPSFDTTIMEVFAALRTGATLYLADAAVRDPASLPAWLARHGITAAFLPTPVAEVLVGDAGWPPGLRLRVLTTGGDQLRLRPPVGTPFRLLNMYGPTECTIVATAGEVQPEPVPTGGAQTEATMRTGGRRDGQPAPTGGLPDIGGPIDDTAVYLLDRRGRPVPPGELGEVYLGGAVVGRGYHRLPGLTATRFLADPFAGRPGARMYRTGDLGRLRPDGTVEFHGRADNQVEIRGHRVEPAEVERVLGAHPAVGEALAVGVPAPGGGTRLVAHVTPAPGAVPDERRLIDWAAGQLPGYLVPARVLTRPSLPRTVNGKLDRKLARELPVPAAAGTLSTAVSGVGTLSTADGGVAATAGGRAEGGGDPVGASAAVLAELCAELLELRRVDPDENFFDLGGDSMLGIRLSVRAAKVGIHFGPVDLLRSGSLYELAATVAGSGSAAGTRAAAGTSGSAGNGVPRNGSAAGAGAAVAPGSAVGNGVTAGNGAAAVARMVPAVVAAPARTGGADPGRRYVPLTPVMHGFLDLPGDPATRLRDFVDMHVFELAATVDAAAVHAAVQSLIARHEPLRYRFRRNELGWHGRCLDPPAAAAGVVDVRQLPPLGAVATAAVLERDAAVLAGQLDLSRGPLLRVRYYRRDAGQDGLLLLVAHHFVVDSVSAVVLLDDLDTALAGLLAGHRPDPTPHPPAWRDWSEHLRDIAVGDDLAAELTYWTGILQAGSSGPRPASTAAGGSGAPAGGSGAPAGGPVHREVGWPPPALPDLVVTEAEAAIAALATGLARWRGTVDVSAMLEGAATPSPYRPHGRPAAVGWFTSLHPVLLPADPGEPVSRRLPAVADRLRSVPHDGVGYGVLRHLTPMSPPLAELRSLPEPDVVLTYQRGGGIPTQAGRLVRPRADLYPRPVRSVSGRFSLALVATARPGSLLLSVLPGAGFLPADLAVLADHVVDALAEAAAAGAPAGGSR